MHLKGFINNLSKTLNRWTRSGEIFLKVLNFQKQIIHRLPQKNPQKVFRKILYLNNSKKNLQSVT